MLAAAFDWTFVSENAGALVAGLGRTLWVSAIAILGALVIGVVLGAARAHRIPVVSQLAAIYVEVIRNTPILVQIFFIFFGLPQLGIRLDAFTVAWLAIMVWGGAFNVENFRAGFEAVPFRYREAGYALGFGRFATFANVTLPCLLAFFNQGDIINMLQGKNLIFQCLRFFKLETFAQYFHLAL